MTQPTAWQAVSTRSVPAPQMLDYWQDATNRLFPPTVSRRPDARGFYGEVAWMQVGRVTVADIVSTKLEVARSANEIRHIDEDCYEVNIQIAGESAFAQDGREIVSGPRSLVLYDSRKPYAMRFEGPYRQMSLKLPRALLHERLADVDALTARRFPLDAAPGRFIYDLLRGLRDEVAPLGEAVAMRLETHILDLLATALIGGAPQPAISARAGALAERQRVMTYIRAHLGDPGLTPQTVAEANHISRRHLYDLFSGEELSVAEWIQEQRLLRIRAALADPLQRPWSIGAIALRHGFRNLSHFSRSFHARFGRSPRDYRQACTH
jgi:AraC-like DNA-binding protein